MASKMEAFLVIMKILNLRAQWNNCCRVSITRGLSSNLIKVFIFTKLHILYSQSNCINNTMSLYNISLNAYSEMLPTIKIVLLLKPKSYIHMFYFLR